MYEIVGSGVGWRVGATVGEGVGDGDGDGDGVGAAVVISTVGVGVGDGEATTTVGVTARNVTASNSAARGMKPIAACRVVSRRIVLG